MFQKVLIANRGEIAVRVMRACREMGIKTVAVFSDVDRDSLHVRFADEAYPIGPPPARESYLIGERIVAVAKKAGAQAIHPGYGFLSERGEFADLCEKEGVVFIGPRGDVMRSMGDKVTARQTMEKAGVPIVPGTTERLTDEALTRWVQDIGPPVMIKAAAGGGGKGMRLVKSEKELASAIARARSEAKSSFGDDSLYVEKFVEEPRHIEIQILADSHGNVVHLFERECSIQRRHQKVIEEAPGNASARAEGEDGRGRGGGGEGRELRRRRHLRVPGRQARPLLLPGDEHPRAGGARDHRDDHRRRHREDDDPGGGRREAAVPAGGPRHQRALDRGPHLRRGRRQQLHPLARRRAGLPAGGRARASASTAASTRAPGSPSSTTRWWPSWWCGAATARRRSSACAARCASSW
jgi:hypothetical protein